MSAETLAGRIELYQLQEFTLQESASLIDESFPRLSILDQMNEEEPPQRIGELIQKLKPYKPLLEKELRSLTGTIPAALILLFTEHCTNDFAAYRPSVRTQLLSEMIL